MTLDSGRAAARRLPLASSQTWTRRVAGAGTGRAAASSTAAACAGGRAARARSPARTSGGPT